MKTKLFILLFLLVGCSHEVLQFYSGPKQPANEVSILVGEESTYLTAIDGKPGPNKHNFFNTGWYKNFVIELEPGIHKMIAFSSSVSPDYEFHLDSWLYNYSKLTLTFPPELSFTFEPGKIYRLRYLQEDSTWINEIEKIPPQNFWQNLKCLWWCDY